MCYRISPSSTLSPATVTAWRASRKVNSSEPSPARSRAGREVGQAGVGQRDGCPPWHDPGRLPPVSRGHPRPDAISELAHLAAKLLLQVTTTIRREDRQMTASMFRKVDCLQIPVPDLE